MCHSDVEESSGGFRHGAKHEVCETDDGWEEERT